MPNNVLINKKWSRVAVLLGLVILLMLPSVAWGYTGYIEYVTGYSNDTGLCFIEGYNITHNFSEKLVGSVTYYRNYGGLSYWRINYQLPDDGSTWFVYAVVYVTHNDLSDGFIDNIDFRDYSATVTTSGTFSGYSSKTATDAANNAATQAQNAANAANQARDAANSASINAWQAADWLNPASGSTSAVKDSQGTVLTAARQARDAANQALSAVSNIQTTVNNINNTINTQDTLPPSVELDTVSGARATSSSSIQLVVAASDNKSTSLTYSVNGGPYSTLPADGKIMAPLPSTGPNTITVRVKDEAGNTAVKTIKIWRLG